MRASSKIGKRLEKQMRALYLAGEYKELLTRISDEQVEALSPALLELKAAAEVGTGLTDEGLKTFLFLASFELLACKETALPCVVTPSYFTAWTVRELPLLSFSMVISPPSGSFNKTLKSLVADAVTPVVGVSAFIAVTAALTLVLLIANSEVADPLIFTE